MSYLTDTFSHCLKADQEYIWECLILLILSNCRLIPRLSWAFARRMKGPFNTGIASKVHCLPLWSPCHVFAEKIQTSHCTVITTSNHFYLIVKTDLIQSSQSEVCINWSITHSPHQNCQTNPSQNFVPTVAVIRNACVRGEPPVIICEALQIFSREEKYKHQIFALLCGLYLISIMLA